MERLLLRAVIFVVFAFLSDGQVFRSYNVFNGLSVSPDGKSVFVVAGGSLLRLDQNLNEQEEVVSFPGSLVAFRSDGDPGTDRSYLCWTNTTEGVCEVRNALGRPSRLLPGFEPMTYGPPVVDLPI